MDPLQGFDLNLLRALDHLLMVRSVTAAARAMSVGQPAMSKMLQRLREELGDPILVRAGREMVPTERAVALAVVVREAMDAARRAISPAHAFIPAEAVGRIRLAMADDAQAVLLTPLVERMQRLSPGLSLRVRRLDASTGADLARGDVHLVVLPDLSRLPGARMPNLSDFVVRPLYEDEFVVVASRGRRRRPRWTMASYAQAEHVLVTLTPGAESGFVDTILQQQGLKRRIAVTVPSFFDAAHIASTTPLVATLPARLARHVRWPLDVQAPPCALAQLAMLMVWHPAHTTPALAFVRKQLALGANA